LHEGHKAKPNVLALLTSLLRIGSRSLLPDFI